MTILQNKDSWILPHEIGTSIPPYRPTYDFGEFINENHKLYSCCATDGLCIALGIPGWLQKEDALKLYELAYYARSAILEVGCYHGLSTCILAQAVKDSGATKPITSIDIEPSCVAESRKHLEQMGLERFVTSRCGPAESMLRDLITSNHKYDFVFVDHSHAYEAVLDACHLLPELVLPGGFCLFHDFNDFRNNDANQLEYGVSRAVFDGLNMQLFEFYGIFGCTGLYRKVS